MEFKAFNKIPRLNRDIVITEKLDGTNAQVYIDDIANMDPDFVLAEIDGLGIAAGSRNRFLTVHGDNFGFANWVEGNAPELMLLGAGTHYGEWWGRGIQRGYGLDHRKFSLFNTARWSDDNERPSVCDVVPVLYDGPFDTLVINAELERLRTNGSEAAPGYMDPEGIIVYHTAANSYFKATVKNDEKPKGA